MTGLEAIAQAIDVLNTMDPEFRTSKVLQAMLCLQQELKALTKAGNLKQTKIARDEALQKENLLLLRTKLVEAEKNLKAAHWLIANGHSAPGSEIGAIKQLEAARDALRAAGGE